MLITVVDSPLTCHIHIHIHIAGLSHKFRGRTRSQIKKKKKANKRKQSSDLTRTHSFWVVFCNGIALSSLVQFMWSFSLNNNFSALYSLVAQSVKNLPPVQETWVRSLGWEGPLEEVTATHSSILAWRIPWKEEPGRLQSMQSQRVGRDRATEHTAALCFKLVRTCQEHT